ncbi:MAG TPA: transposase [Ignavibacteriaceae bacterium]
MQKKCYRYSLCFQQSVVQAIEKDGLSISEARRRYNIAGGQTIQNWVRKFGKNHLLNKVITVSTLSERDELSRLKTELKTLKIAYAELSMDHKCSEKVIELADEMFGMDLKKKYEQELSQNSVKQSK